MKTLIHDNTVTLWLSANDTYNWARKSGAAWPCSDLSGRRLVACFDRNGLCDFSIDGGRGSQEVSSDELSAICADHLTRKLSRKHPAWFVAVRQFLGLEMVITYLTQLEAGRGC